MNAVAKEVIQKEIKIMAVKAKTEAMATRYQRLRNNITNTQARLTGYYNLIGASGAGTDTLAQIRQIMINSLNQLDDANIGIPTDPAEIALFNVYAKAYEDDNTYVAVTEMAAFRSVLNTAIADTETEFPDLATTYPNDHAKITAMRTILETVNSEVT